ncbi:hypothetical protein COU60_02725, partial [Candidatus Pacearchaeota archaeon CG10_big_fil_rev_8_21_14_0_10_34_76]
QGQIADIVYWGVNDDGAVSAQNFSDIYDLGLSLGSGGNPDTEITKNVSSLEFGTDSINITWLAKDDVDHVDSSVFNITFPNGSSLFNSINQNGTIILEPSNLTVIGIYGINLWANDSYNNENQSSDSFDVLDLVFPSIDLIYPENISYNKVISDLNYTVGDNYALDSCWYSLDGGTNNASVTCGVNLTGLSSSQGSNTWGIYANDSLGNENSSRVTFFVDSVFPLIEFGVGSEETGTNFSRDHIYVNVSVVEVNEANITFRLYDETDNLLNDSTYTDFNRGVNWTGLSDGLYKYNVSVEDFLANTNSTDTRIIRLDNSGPLIVIDYPQSIIYLDNESLPLNVSVLDEGVGVDSCWWNIDNGNNDTIICGQNTTFNTSEGSHEIEFFSNDTLGNLNMESVIFSISAGDPSIILESPVDGAWLNYKQDILFSYTPTHPEGIDVCSLYSDWTGLWQINQTNFDPQNATSNNFTASIDGYADGIYNWNIWCNNSLGNDAFGLVNYSLNVDTLVPLVEFGFGTETTNVSFSRSNVYVNISVVESNEANITFRLYNGEGIVSENSFSDGTREINWTFLLDDLYYYNVTVVDLAGNDNFTETRIILLDTTVPLIEILSPENITYTSDNLDFNYSVSDINGDSCWYTTDGGTTNFSLSNCSNTTLSILQGSTNLILYMNDSAGNENSDSVTFFVDSIIPLVSYGEGTVNDGTEVETNFVYVNVSFTENNFANITYYLFDSNGIVNESIFETEVNEINWTGLISSNVTYYYNVSVVDEFGNLNSTVTRSIILVDLNAPSLVLVEPQNTTYTFNESLPLNFAVSDFNLDSCWYNLNKGVNVSLSGCANSTFDTFEGSNTLYFYINDTLGNFNLDSVTFNVNNSLVFTENYSVQRGSVSVNGQIDVPIHNTDITKAFVIHTASSADSGPDTLKVTATIINSSTIRFQNYAGGSATVEWELITGPGINVKKGTLAFSNTDAILDANISEINLSNSFIVVESRLNSGTGNQIIGGFWTARFNNASQIRFERQSTGTAGEIAYQVISLIGAKVQNGSFTTALTSGTANLVSTTSMNHSFLIFSKSLDSGTSLTSYNIAGDLTNNNTITFTRQSTSGNMWTEWFVVEWPYFIVERGQIIVSGGGAVNQAIKELFFLNKSFNVPSWSSTGGGTTNANAFLTSSLTSVNNLQFLKGAASQTQTVEWQVIEIIELDPPTINLFYPTDGFNISGLSVEFFNYSVSDSNSILNCSLLGNWSGGWHINQTELNPLRETTINFSSVDVGVDGYYEWNVECIDIYGNKGNNLTNFSFAAFNLPYNSPISININQTSNNGTGNVSLSWGEVSNALNYNVYYSDDLSGNFILLNTTAEINFTDYTFAGNKRRFYRVNALNPTGENVSTDIFSAQVYTLAHNGNTRNWIGFASNASYLNNANDTLNEIIGATAISMWNATMQKKSTCNGFSCPAFPSCTDTNCNFDLNLGFGYEVNLNSSYPSQVNWSLVGKVHDPINITLIKNQTGFGKNWISIYGNSSLTDARSLLLNVTNSESVSRWNPFLQTSAGYVKIGEIFFGTNFPILLEEGYEISVSQTTNWTQGEI